MPLNEILIPSLALISKPTQTIYSDDLVGVDVNEEVVIVETIPSFKHKCETSKKRKRDYEKTYLSNIWIKLYNMRETVEKMKKAQESMEYLILQKLRYEFSKQKLVVEVREDARAEQINNIIEVLR